MFPNLNAKPKHRGGKILKQRIPVVCPAGTRSQQTIKGKLPKFPQAQMGSTCIYKSARIKKRIKITRDLEAI